MTTIEFLSRALEIDNKISAEREQLAALRASAERCTSNLSAVPGGHSGESRPPERLAIAITELESKIQADTLALAEAEEEIVAFIYSALDDSYERRVVKGIYLDGLSFQELAERMTYSDRHIHRLHDQAVKKLETQQLKILSEDVWTCPSMSLACPKGKK